MSVDGRHEAVAIKGAPHEVVFDALNRAVRTWWAAVGAGLLTALGDLGLQLLVTGDPLAGDFWRALVRGLVMAVLTAVFSYLARFKAPPPPELTPPAEPAAAAVVVVHQAEGMDYRADVVQAVSAAPEGEPPVR